MTPEAERIRDTARTDILESLVKITGREKTRLRATEDDMLMFCIYGLTAFVRAARDEPQMMMTVIELLADACGATADGEITERREDA